MCEHSAAVYGSCRRLNLRVPWWWLIFGMTLLYKRVERPLKTATASHADAFTLLWGLISFCLCLRSDYWSTCPPAWNSSYPMSTTVHLLSVRSLFSTHWSKPLFMTVMFSPVCPWVKLDLLVAPLVREASSVGQLPTIKPSRNWPGWPLFGRPQSSIHVQLLILPQLFVSRLSSGMTQWLS